MGNILGRTDHISGGSSGDAPGSDKSRVGQGLDIPKISSSVRVPKSVSGTHSYGIRHTKPLAVKAVSPGAKEGSLPSIPKAPKQPKLGNEI